jgi:dienelactone hydrolase
MRYILHSVTAAAVMVLLPAIAQAEIVTETVRYSHGEQAFEGYAAYNSALGSEQPTVIIIHDWDGLGDYEKARAEMLAQAGYAAFAVDLFGAGVRPQSIERRRQLTNALYADRDRMRALMESGLDAADNQSAIGADTAVAIGYCFGGAAALEWARSGADLEGFVSFHGGLATPDGQTYEQVQAPLLILHGSNDQVAPMSDVADLAARLDEDSVAYDMEIYGGARHAFTDWHASQRYDASADLKSWAAMMDFLGQALNANN